MDDKRPLQDEAERRSEWRGEEGTSQPDAAGHTLPASEDQYERMGHGGSDTSLPASEENEEGLVGDFHEEPVSHPGVIPPPD